MWPVTLDRLLPPRERHTCLLGGVFEYLQYLLFPFSHSFKLMHWIYVVLPLWSRRKLRNPELIRWPPVRDSRRLNAPSP